MNTIVDFNSRKPVRATKQELTDLLMQESVCVVLCDPLKFPWVLTAEVPGIYWGAHTWSSLRSGPCPSSDLVLSVWLPDTPEFREMLEDKCPRPMRGVLIPPTLYDALAYPLVLSDSINPDYSAGDWFSISFVHTDSLRISMNRHQEIEPSFDDDPEIGDALTYAHCADDLWQTLLKWEVHEKALRENDFIRIPNGYGIPPNAVEVETPFSQRFYLHSVDWNRHVSTL